MPPALAGRFVTIGQSEKSRSFFFFFKDDFLEQFLVYHKTEREEQRCLIYSLTLYMYSSFITNMIHQNGASIFFLTKDESKLKCNNHPKYIVYLKVHSGSYTFSGFESESQSVESNSL